MITVLLGNFTFHHFTDEELQMLEKDTEQKALIHELEEVKTFSTIKEAYDEADNTHHLSWIIPSEFTGEIIFDKSIDFEQMIKKIKTEDLINLQKEMMMKKTNKTSMNTINLLEDVINERVKSK